MTSTFFWCFCTYSFCSMLLLAFTIWIYVHSFCLRSIMSNIMASLLDISLNVLQDLVHCSLYCLWFIWFHNVTCLSPLSVQLQPHCSVSIDFCYWVNFIGTIYSVYSAVAGKIIYIPLLGIWIGMLSLWIVLLFYSNNK